MSNRKFGNILGKVKPETFFVVMSVLLALCYTTLKPPLMGPDETNHFYRAWQISEGRMIPVKEQSRVGGWLPAGVYEMACTYRPYSFSNEIRLTKADFLAAFDISVRQNEKVFIDFPNTSFYSPLVYLPQAFIILILKQTGLSMGSIYYAGKLFLFLLWLLLMFRVIKSFPFLKWTLVFVLLLPMNSYLINSYSGDIVNLLFCLAFLSMVLNDIYLYEVFTRKRFVQYLLIAIALVFCKVIYAALLCLLLLIPLTKFGGSRTRAGFISVVYLVAVASAAIWSLAVNTSYITFEDYDPVYRRTDVLYPGADMSLQKAYLADHPGQIFTVVKNSLMTSGGFYCRSFVSGLGVFIDIMPFEEVVWFAFACIILVIIIQPISVRIPFWHRLFFLMLAFLIYSLMVFTQYLIWAPVGGDQCEAIQGRYFYPVVPLLCLCLLHRRSLFLFNPFLPVLAATAFLNYKSLQSINARYNTEPGNKICYVHFDAEKESADAGTHVTGKEKHSGNFSLSLPNDTVRGFVFKQKGLLKGDIVELSVWYKGAGVIINSLVNDTCISRNYTSDFAHVTDSSGWSKVLLVYRCDINCPGSDHTFFIKSKSEHAVFIDDAEYRVTRRPPGQ